MKVFVISLDFELLWGVMDSRGAEYHEQLSNVYKVVPKILSLFDQYEVSCTWATVGLLFLESKDEFDFFKPELLPQYKNKKFNPYIRLNETFQLDNKLLFASKLIEDIILTPRQEVASHTFSHYYCLEDGQSLEEFKCDLESNRKVAEKYNITFDSLIFPRNQFNETYLKACSDVGFISYRGNPKHWAYQVENRNSSHLLKRMFRLVDAYIPMSGSLRQKVNIEKDLVDIPASLFLRAFSKRVSLIEPLRLWRIKWSMSRAAKKGGVFHLWWHPHNFGKNITENLDFLEKILIHYQYLNKKYNFKSMTMANIASQVKNK